MKAAKHYDLPASSLLSLMMRSVAEGRRIPEMGMADPDVRTPELEAAAQQAEAEYKAGKTIPLSTVMREAWYTG